MSNELAVIEKNWLSLAGQGGDFPVPFEQTVFLTECHLAGTAEIDDILVKTQNVDAGAPLVLKRTVGVDAADARAIAAETQSGARIGYVPRRHGAMMARLMDAGKNLIAKVVGKDLEGHWLDVTIAIEMKEA